MKVNNYILKEIKPLTLQHTVKDVQDLCTQLSVSHVVILENNRLLGCFFEGDVLTIEQTDLKLAEYYYLLQHFHASEDATHLELIKIFADNEANIVPVINKELKYIGYYELSDVLDVFSSTPFFYDESEILIVEKAKKEISMSEVAQIVEANNAKLVGLYISSEEENKTQIILKIVTEEVNELIQTFRRYEYHVLTKHEDDFYLEELKNRSEYLQKYLNM